MLFISNVSSFSVCAACWCCKQKQKLLNFYCKIEKVSRMQTHFDDHGNENKRIFLGIIIIILKSDQFCSFSQKNTDCKKYNQRLVNFFQMLVIVILAFLFNKRKS